MRKGFLITLLAGAALIVPQAAFGGGASGQLHLPPIPYAQTVPWLIGEHAPKSPAYLGLLLVPVPSAAPPTQFAEPSKPASATTFNRYAVNRALSTESASSTATQAALALRLNGMVGLQTSASSSQR